MPSAGRDSQSFADVLQDHLEEWRFRAAGSRRRYWDHWADGVYPEYRELALAVVREDGVRLHPQAAHLRSSQVFAFNLFLPFRKGNREHLSLQVSEAVGASLTIEDIRFEWVPPGHILGELDGDHPVGDEPATGVDVVLWGRLEDGARCVVLVEVKLSETDFTHCNGRTSRANRRRDVCDSADLFSRTRRPVTSRGLFTNGGTGGTGRYSPTPMAVLGKHSLGLTVPDPVPSPSACSSRCGTWLQPGASNRTERWVSPGHGSRCVLMTPTRTSPGSGRNGGASCRTSPWPRRSRRPRWWLPGRPRALPDGRSGCAAATCFEGTSSSPGLPWCTATP